MTETTSRFGLAEKTRLDLGQLAFFKRLRQRHGLDRHQALELCIMGQINQAHGPLAERLFEQIAAIAQRPDRLGSGLSGLRHAATAPEALFEITELRVVASHVAIDLGRLGELPLALKIERQSVESLHQLIVERTLAEYLIGFVELPLPLQGQAKQALRCGRSRA